jgi:hypothetical protein
VVIQKKLMKIALPYAFDTSKTGKLMIYGVVGLLAIVVIPGLIKFLFIAPNTVGLIGVFCIGGMLAFFGYILVKRLGGATGTITKQEIVVMPTTFWGVKSNEPERRFPLTQFRGVLVEQILWAADRFSPHERVSLKGKEDCPAILIARTERQAGLILGRELGVLLDLPVEERLSSY